MNTSDKDTVKNTSTSINLPQICDLVAVGKFHADISDELDRPELLLSAGSVERCSTALVQVLVAASQELKTQGRRLRIAEMSDPFKQSFADLGLEGCLRSWE